MTTPLTVDLTSVTAWEQVTLPHTDRPVALARLRVGARQGLSALVWYPAGWEFRTNGSYATDLDVVVLDGSFTIAGTTLRAGEYAYLESGYFWSGAKTVTGALVFQRFAESPRWVPAERPRARISQKSCFLPSVTFTDPSQSRLLRQGHGTVTRLAARLAPFNVADADTELLDLARRHWHYLPTGAVLPALDRVLVISPAP